MLSEYLENVVNAEAHHRHIKVKTEINKRRISSCLSTKLQRLNGVMHAGAIWSSLFMDKVRNICTKLLAGIDQTGSYSDYVSLYFRELLI